MTLPEYVFDRSFAAPLGLVWRTWTDPVLLARWYGPGVDTIIHGYDLRPGGAWLNETRWGEKSDFSRMDFQAVDPQERLVWNHRSADKDFNPAPSQMMPDWPQNLLTTVTFVAAEEQTNVRLTQVPVDGSEAEIATFAERMRGMDNGWGAGYRIIDDILADLSA